MLLISGIMKVKEFKGGYDDNFCYLIWCDKTLEGAIIDPSVEPDKIFHFINQNDILLKKILITHTHYDHISYLTDFISMYLNVVIYGYVKTRYSFNNNFYGLSHNEKISIGDEIFTSLYTPGHYDDCLCYWNKSANMIFTGDTIFVGRSGRTINMYSDISKLYHSIYDIILKLPKETIIYPGHDYGPTSTISISDNMELSHFFSCKSEKEFIDVMDDFETSR